MFLINHRSEREWWAWRRVMMSLSLLLLRKIKPWLTTWTIWGINQGNLNMYWEEFLRPGNATQACSSANLLEASCLTHSELCPMAGSQETLVRLWAWKEQMATEQTPASSVRLRNKILASWALERQADTLNISVTAKSNAKSNLPHTEKSWEASSLWNCRMVFCAGPPEQKSWGSVNQSDKLLFFMRMTPTLLKLCSPWSKCLCERKSPQFIKAEREDITLSTCLFHLSKCPHSHSSFLLQPANKCSQVKYHRHTDHKRPPVTWSYLRLLKLPCLQLLTYRSEGKKKKRWELPFSIFQSPPSSYWIQWPSL